MRAYTYRIYVPDGNDTALVLGLADNSVERAKINDAIQKKHSNVEQVGFLSEDNLNPQLVMAGGEFCGNAARTAVWHYLKGLPGELSIAVSGAENQLKAGITDSLQVWTQMPVDKNLGNIKTVADGFHLVPLDGITHIVVDPVQAAAFIKNGEEGLKISAKNILTDNHLLDCPAAGVIFLENTVDDIKIHPCVYVSGINTMFYESACGSGTVAVGLVMCLKQENDVNVSLIQPSNKTIRTIIKRQGFFVTEAIISGGVTTDGVIYNIRS